MKVHSWDGTTQKEHFYTALEEMETQIGLDLHVEVPHNTTVPVEECKKMIDHLYNKMPERKKALMLVWSHYERPNEVKPLNASYMGISGFCTDEPFNPSSPQGKVIKIEDTPFAEVIDYDGHKIIYLLYDAIHKNNEGTRKMFSLVVNCIKDLINGDEYDPFEVYAETLNSPSEHFRALFETRKKEYQAIIDKGRDEIATYKKKILDKVELIRDAEMMVWGIEAESKNFNVAELIKKCTSVPNVKSVHFTEDEFVIRINDVTIDYAGDGKTYDIGNLVCYISLKNGQMHIENLTRKINGHHGIKANHPHDIRGSRADVSKPTMYNTCMGEIAPVTPKLIGEFRFEALTALVRNFCFTANEDDSAGRTIEHWPVVRKTETND